MMRLVLIAAFAVTIFSGCGTCARSANRSFFFGRDNFAFTNDLVWSYEFGPGDVVNARPADPPPEHPLRCFPMTRSVREFFYHARFDPTAEKLDPEAYRKLIKKVLDRNSRCPSPQDDHIIIPGYAHLNALSADFPNLLRDQFGGPISSYLQRGNWRMIFPIPKSQHRKTAKKLVHEIEKGHLPIVHVFRFPDVSLNHAVLLYAAKVEEDGVTFQAYDPNNAQRPAELTFDTKTSSFLFERNQYFVGGKVKVYEVYRGLCY